MRLLTVILLALVCLTTLAFAGDKVPPLTACVHPTPYSQVAGGFYVTVSGGTPPYNVYPYPCPPNPNNLIRALSTSNPNVFWIECDEVQPGQSVYVMIEDEFGELQQTTTVVNICSSI